MKKLFLSVVLSVVFLLCALMSFGCLYVWENIRPKNIAILYIATGRYITFWDEFYPAMEKYFLPNYKKTYFIFTDDTTKVFPDNVVRVYQEHREWPNIVVNKYAFFYGVSDKLSKFDYIFYFNGNLIPQRIVGDEVIPSQKQKLMFTQHPAFYCGATLCSARSLTYERNSKSTAFIPFNEGKYYVMAGFWGGRTKDVLTMIKILKKRTDIDTARGVIAIWHDESHLNRYLIDYEKKGGNPLILDPRYAVPEEALFHSLIYSKLGDFIKDPYMIILDKSRRGGHGWFRSTDLSSGGK